MLIRASSQPLFTAGVLDGFGRQFIEQNIEPKSMKLFSPRNGTTKKLVPKMLRNLNDWRAECWILIEWQTSMARNSGRWPLECWIVRKFGEGRGQSYSGPLGFHSWRLMVVGILNGIFLWIAFVFSESLVSFPLKKCLLVGTNWQFHFNRGTTARAVQLQMADHMEH